MHKDIAPEEMERYLDMFDRAEMMTAEVEEALSAGQGNLVELAEVKEFLAERQMILEAFAGEMNDTHILVIPALEV